MQILQTQIRSYFRTNEKDENYIPLGINAGGIKITYNGLYAFMIGASDTNKLASFKKESNTWGGKILKILGVLK